MDRRDFVIASSLATAAASLRWLRLGGLVQASGVQSDVFAPVAPAASPASHVFESIARAVLPFEDQRFSAIAPATVIARALELFSLDRDAAMQQNFALFNDLRKFPAPPVALLATEAALFPIEESEKKEAAPSAARLARDQKFFEAFTDKLARKTQAFTDLGLADQRSYLMLWARSALGIRRRFYRSAKTLVVVAAYSMDEVWPIIGYAGPLLHLPPS